MTAQRRPKIAAGNWKMNHNLSSTLAYAQAFSAIAPHKEHPAILFPPLPFIAALAEACRANTNIAVGAQTCHEAIDGAFTGEVAPEMLASVGATYVIVGHSERRSIYHENNALLAAKTDAVIRAGLVPVFCCGEPLSVREQGGHFDLVKEQIEEGVFHLSAAAFSKIIIAYEPVWAIGTGVTASAEQAQEMHAYIRQLIAAKYGHPVADMLPILYGGSVKPQNAASLFGMPDVDGGLVGGASLDATDFAAIVNALPY